MGSFEIGFVARKAIKNDVQVATNTKLSSSFNQRKHATKFNDFIFGAVTINKD